MKDETNIGVNKNSRRYIRGVLYPEIARLRITSVITLLAMLSIPADDFSGVRDDSSEEKETVGFGCIIPLLSVVLGLLYLMFCRAPEVPHLWSADTGSQAMPPPCQGT